MPMIPIPAIRIIVDGCTTLGTKVLEMFLNRGKWKRQEEINQLELELAEARVRAEVALDYAARAVIQRNRAIVGLIASWIGWTVAAVVWFVVLA